MSMRVSQLLQVDITHQIKLPECCAVNCFFFFLGGPASLNAVNLEKKGFICLSVFFFLIRLLLSIRVPGDSVQSGPVVYCNNNGGST